MQRKWRRAMRRDKFTSLINKIVRPAAVLGFVLATIAGMGVHANPSGGQVTTGSGTITQNGNVMTVAQNTNLLGINWQNFNIGANETVNFLQPSANAVALNRVIGNQASVIYGKLTANGKVFLVNSNGVLFAPGAQINVGGLVASSLDIKDSDFRAGNYKFSGENSGSVINQGTIHAANGGYVALLGAQAKNEGIIVAQQGTIALGAGNAMTMDMNGDGLVRVVVDRGAVEALAENKNIIQADAGKVIMTARTANALSGTAVNNTGIIRARSISNSNGSIILDGRTGGIVTNSGTLDASGKAAGQTGGTVKLLGDKVGLLSNSQVDVSGNQGGGTALIGGNYQGKGTEQNANQTVVEKNAVINADALTTGNGGKVVVWADGTTVYQGSISARGGAVSGNGGMAEVSSKQMLSYQGNTDLRAANGKIGSLLLDPNNIYVVSGGGAVSDIVFVPSSGSDSTISGASLSSALSAANVVLQADNDIKISDNITADMTATSLYNSLKLQAGRSIIIDNNAQITTNHGDVTAIINDEHAGANRDTSIGSYAQFEMKNGSQINTNGGNITINYGSFGGIEDGSVFVGSGGSAVLDAKGGTIDIAGITTAVGAKAITIANYSEVKTNGTGTIIINGTGKNGGNHTGGVNITSHAQVGVENGQLSITGLSSANNDHNTGVEIDNGGVISSTGSGAITIKGTGGTGADSNFGIYVSNANITVKNGSLMLDGESHGNHVGNHGVIVTDSGRLESTGTGSITISGKSGSGSYDNFGIQLDSNATITAKFGDIDLIGRGHGNQYFNVGIVVGGNSTIESTGVESVGVHAAKVSLDGKGESSGTIGDSNARDAYGIWLLNGGIKSKDGNIAVVGVAGNGGGIFNSGIRIDSDGYLSSSGIADITLTGTGGVGRDHCYGVDLKGGKISSTLGKITVTGTGGNAQYDFNAGVTLETGSTIQTSSGDVELHGTGGNGTWDNYGLWLSNTKVITANGNIIADGSASGVGDNNSGIRIDDTIGNLLQSTGNGEISLNGKGGSGINGNSGIWIFGGIVSANAGNTNFVGTRGAATGSGNYGVNLLNANISNYLAGGSATVSINGIGNGTSGNEGVAIGNVNAGANKLIVSADDIVLNGTISSSASGNAVVLAAGNTLTANGIINVSDPLLGRWLAYVNNAGKLNGTYWANNYSFTQYGTAYNNGSGIIPYDSAVIQGSGNGLIYTTPLSITQSLTGTVSKLYDGTKSVNNLSTANYQIGSVPGFTTAIVSAPTTGIYATKNVGSGILVTAAPAILNVSDSNNKPVYGYSSPAAIGNIGTIIAGPVNEETAVINTDKFSGLIGSMIGNASNNIPDIKQVMPSLIHIVEPGINVNSEIIRKGLFTMHTKYGDAVTVVSVIINRPSEAATSTGAATIHKIDGTKNQMIINKDLTDTLRISFPGSTTASYGSAAVKYNGADFIIGQVSTAFKPDADDKVAEKILVNNSFTIIFDNGQTDTYRVELIGTQLRISHVSNKTYNTEQLPIDFSKLVISIGLKVTKDNLNISSDEFNEVIWNL